MRYFKNTSWLFVEKILRMILGIFISIWIARYLGPEQFGLFSYAQSFAGLFSVVATLGLNGIVVRELVKNKEKEQDILATSFYLKLIGAFFVLSTLIVAINITSNDFYINSLIFIIASSTIFQSFNVIDFYFQSKVLSRYVVYANFISLLISSFVKIGLILSNAPLIAFAWVVLFDSFILAMGLIYFYNKSKNSIKLWRFDKKIAFDLLKDSWPLIIASVGYTVYSKIDQVMLYNMLDVHTVGIYSVGVGFISVFVFIPTIVVNSIYPYLVKNEYSLEKIIIHLYRFLIFISFLFILLIYFFGENLIIQLYGSQYFQTSSIIIILSISFLFESIATINGRWIWIMNKQIISLYRTIFGALINILLNIYLIPIYKIQGAVYATLITLFLSTFIYYLVHKETRIITMTITKAIFTFYKMGDFKQWVKK